MRAVNLIPAERRRGGTSGTGRSGGGAQVLLGGLAGLVLMAVLWGIAHQQAANRKAQAAQATAQAAAVEGRAGALAGYQEFADLRQRRVQGISQLVAGRFDWALVMREVATALPTDVRLISFTGSVTPGAATSSGPASASAGSAPAPAPPAPAAASASAGGSASGAGGAGAAASAGPSVQLSGCASSQSGVADVLNRLRAIPGVADVGLGASEKASTGQAASPTDCGSSQPKFSIAISFSPLSPVSGGPAGSPTTPGQPPTTTPGQPPTTPRQPGASPGQPAIPARSATPASASTAGAQQPARSGGTP